MKSCVPCASKSSVKTDRPVPLQRFPMAQERLAAWSVDFVGPITLSERGNRVIFTAVESFTRWPEAVALPNMESETLAQAFIETIVARYGVPRLVHSDRGSNFISELMMSVYKILRIKKTETSPYHPMANGFCENFHRYLGNALKMVTGPAQTDWDIQLPYALLSYRVSFHRFHGDSPAYALFGQDLDLPVYSMMEADIPGRYSIGLTPAGVGAEVALRLSKARDRYMETMEKQTRKTHETANRGREPVSLGVGDCVLFKRPLTARGKSQKLWKPYIGPFKIIEKMGEATFVIKEVGGRKQYQSHAENLFKSEGGFRRDVEIWASEAEEVIKDLKTLKDVSPTLFKHSGGEGNAQDKASNANAEGAEGEEHLEGAVGGEPLGGEGGGEKVWAEGSQSTGKDGEENRGREHPSVEDPNENEIDLAPRPQRKPRQRRQVTPKRHGTRSGEAGGYKGGSYIIGGKRVPESDLELPRRRL